MQSKSKVFVVTGGAGFIGSAVVRHLIADTPHSVVVVDKLTYAGNLDSLAAGRRRIPATASSGPTSSTPRAMRRIFADARPDVVMHLAAESHVDRSIDGPDAFIQTNVVGTFALLEAALGYWRELEDERRRQLSASITSRPTRCSARSAPTAASPRTRPTGRTRPIRPPRRRPTIWCGPGTAPTACRS